MKKIQIVLLLLLFSICAYPQFSGLKKGLKGIAKKVLITEQTSTDETTSEAPAEEQATPFIPNKDLTFTPAEAIDLGLPSGTKWASYNIGASKPEEFGGYYAWGETEVKEVYSEATHTFKSEKTDLDLEDDVANIKWGAGWRIPTREEIQELLDKCEWTLDTLNGVKGQQVTGPNGNSIFLPAAGEYIDSEVTEIGIRASFWSSTRNRYTYNAVLRLYLENRMEGCAHFNRWNGSTIRPVTK